jgi:hypothetical protein
MSPTFPAKENGEGEHRGYYKIRSENVYYTAHYFASLPKTLRAVAIRHFPKCRCMTYLGTYNKIGTRHTRRLRFHLQGHSKAILIEAGTNI